MSQSSDAAADESGSGGAAPRMSARILGAMFALTGQEMNALLKREGFLDGDPGAYSVTNKGEPYASEKDHHRGTGGSSWYNRDWTTRTWDPSITDELNITDEKKREIRAQVTEARRTARAPEPYVAGEAEGPAPDDDDVRRGLNPGGVAVIAGLAAGASYGIYKAAPHLKRFVAEKVAPRFRRRHRAPSESPARAEESCQTDADAADAAEQTN